MSSQVIIAICGKSATGKDTLFNYMKKNFSLPDEPISYIVSDTTRPKRDYEKNGIDYNFISTQSFLLKKDQKEYLEYMEFKGWYYGTPIDQIQTFISIGIFSPSGIKECKNKGYIIIPILLKQPWWVRLKRSYNRERKISFEYFRRMFVDWRDFKNFEKWIKEYCGKYDYIIQSNDDEQSLFLINENLKIKIRSFLK